MNDSIGGMYTLWRGVPLHEVLHLLNFTVLHIKGHNVFSSEPTSLKLSKFIHCSMYFSVCKYYHSTPFTKRVLLFQISKIQISSTYILDKMSHMTLSLF